jgi:hypothetical protein
MKDQMNPSKNETILKSKKMNVQLVTLSGPAKSNSGSAR